MDGELKVMMKNHTTLYYNLVGKVNDIVEKYHKKTKTSLTYWRTMSVMIKGIQLELKLVLLAVIDSRVFEYPIYYCLVSCGGIALRTTHPVLR